MMSASVGSGGAVILRITSKLWARFRLHSSSVGAAFGVCADIEAFCDAEKPAWKPASAAAATCSSRSAFVAASCSAKKT